MTEPLRLRTPEDFFAALRSPDEGMRLAVLQAISRNPEAARSYGSLGGRDVVDEVALLVRTLSPRSGSWRAAAAVLSCFPEERATAAFTEFLAHAQDAEAVRIAAERVPPERLRPLLRDDRRPHAVRAAAERLRGFPGLEAAERLRVALACGEDATAPADDWVRELAGPFAVEAQVALERQGRSAFLLLRPRFAALGVAARRWMLPWAARCWPAEAADLLCQALDGPDEAVLLAALRVLAGYPSAGTLFAERLDRLAADPRPEVRRAALRAGGSDGPWRERVAQEGDAEALRARLERLGGAEAAQDPEALCRLLEHPHWTVRGAASAALARAGDAALEPLRRVVRQGSLPARTGAVQALLALDQQEWLEEQLLS